MSEMTDYAIVPETPATETISLGTTAKPAKEVVLTGRVRDASDNGATPAQIATAVSQAASAIPSAQKGAANGVSTLGADSKIPTAQIPDAVLGQVEYQGTWAASSNTPTLANPPAATTKGYYYVCSDGGTQFGITFATGDWIISNGSAWEKVDNTDAVTSVFGRTGAVSLLASDIAGVINGADADSLTDADEFCWYKSVGGLLKKITWANIKATLKTYFDSLYATIAHDGWIALTATTDFSTTAASTSTATMNTDQTANIAVGYELRYTTGGTVRYGCVDAIASNLLTIGGYPFTEGAGNLTALAYRRRQCAEQDIFISGPFAGAGARTNLHAADMLSTLFTPCLRYAVKVWMRPSTDDTGANQTVCNLYNGANAVLTTGLTLADSAAAESVVEFGSYYEFAAGAVIDLGCGTEGSNDDSVNLTAKVLWCYP